MKDIEMKVWNKACDILDNSELNPTAKVEQITGFYKAVDAFKILDKMEIIRQQFEIMQIIIKEASYYEDNQGTL